MSYYPTEAEQMKNADSLQTFVDIKHVLMGSLPAQTTSVYSELIIVNYTRNTIVVIDERNNRTTVPPCLEAEYRGTVQIDHRSSNQVRDKRMRSGAVESLLDGTRISIPYWMLVTGTYYVEHLNLLLTNCTTGANILHPMSSPLYTSALVKAIKEECSLHDQPTMRFLANDPEGRVSTIYGCIADKVIAIPCTNQPDVDAAFATLNIVLSTPDDNLIFHRVKIEELVSTGRMCLEENMMITTLGLTREEAENAMVARRKLQKQSLIDATNKRMAQEREDTKEREQRLVEDAKAERERFKVKLENSEAANAQLKAQLQTAESKAAEWHSLYTVQAERAEADEKVRKANAAADSEAIKTAGVVWKIAAGFIIAVAVPIIKHYIAATSSKKE
jgi:hypothetical protein